MVTGSENQALKDHKVQETILSATAKDQLAAHAVADLVLLLMAEERVHLLVVAKEEDHPARHLVAKENLTAKAHQEDLLAVDHQAQRNAGSKFYELF